MNFLSRIAARKRLEAGERFGSSPPALSGAGLGGDPPSGGAQARHALRPFSDALGRGSGIIAEIKRRSPSRGEIRSNLRAAELARAYEEGGASAISVVTESEHFGGSLDDLARAREATSLPVLRKDFLVHRQELLESRHAGADAVLLIAGILSEKELSDLLQVTHFLGMEALVEVHQEEDLQRVLATSARMVGINNRDLTTLEVDLETSRRLLPQIPRDRVVVVESGLKDGRQLGELRRLGARGFLVGEALLAAPDPGTKLRELIGGENGKDQSQGLRHHQSG